MVGTFDVFFNITFELTGVEIKMFWKFNSAYFTVTFGSLTVPEHFMIF
jgi:hypothetical protein